MPIYTHLKKILVPKGFTQTHVVDYDETFSLVTMIKSIRILFSIPTYYKHEICNMDVKTAFLNGHLEEDISIKAILIKCVSLRDTFIG